MNKLTIGFFICLASLGITGFVKFSPGFDLPSWKNLQLPKFKLAIEQASDQALEVQDELENVVCKAALTAVFKGELQEGLPLRLDKDASFNLKIKALSKAPVNECKLQVGNLEKFEVLYQHSYAQPVQSSDASQKLYQKTYDFILMPKTNNQEQLGPFLVELGNSEALKMDEFILNPYVSSASQRKKLPCNVYLAAPVTEMALGEALTLSLKVFTRLEEDCLPKIFLPQAEGLEFKQKFSHEYEQKIAGKMCKVREYKVKCYGKKAGRYSLNFLTEFKPYNKASGVSELAFARSNQLEVRVISNALKRLRDGLLITGAFLNVMADTANAMEKNKNLKS